MNARMARCGFITRPSLLMKILVSPAIPNQRLVFPDELGQSVKLVDSGALCRSLNERPALSVKVAGHGRSKRWAWSLEHRQSRSIFGLAQPPGAVAPTHPAR